MSDPPARVPGASDLDMAAFRFRLTGTEQDTIIVPPPVPPEPGTLPSDNADHRR